MADLPKIPTPWGLVAGAIGSLLNREQRPARYRIKGSGTEFGSSEDLYAALREMAQPPPIDVPNEPPPGEVEMSTPPVEVPPTFPEPDPPYPLERLDRERPIVLQGDPPSWPYRMLPRYGGRRGIDTKGKYELPADDLGELIRRAQERRKDPGADAIEFCEDYELGWEFCNFIWGPERRPVPTSPRGRLPPEGRTRTRGAGRAPPRGGRDTAALLGGLVPKSPERRRPRLPAGRLPAFANTLAFRPPATRPPRPREGVPAYPRVDIFEIMRQNREATRRAREQREDLFRRGIPPPPTPDELAPYPVEPWPQIRTFPVPEPEEIPDIVIPAPPPPAPPEVPERSPLPPVLKPPAPVRTRPTRTRRAPPPRAPKQQIIRQTLPATLGAASILRAIHRRKTGAERLSLSAPQTVAPPARIDNPIEERLQPETVVPGLTPIQGASVGLQPLGLTTPQGFRRAQRQDECVCEETPEEKEEERERSRSNVVADVKPYRRRMSQNSLDNLRK